MKSNYQPLIVVGFLVFAGMGLRNWSFPKPNTTEVFSIIGGEPSQSSAEQSLLSLAHSQILVGIAEGAEISSDSGTLTQQSFVEADNADGVPDIDAAGLAYNAATVQDPGQPIGLDRNNSTTTPVATQEYPVITASVSQKLPNLNSDFIMPTKGYDEGILQSDNSVDIQNSCGTPVIAAANGVVVPDNNIIDSAGGWNDGYGTFVLLEHPFGNEVFTRYAHLQEALVGIGDYVKQGQEIGLIGETGNAGTCSLSFEVIGAQNPFANK
jgi:murein DD-endopeptidase MepM/ murein hydrolase activator NlpD